MADYLSSIVARASQATPSLAPRVPSLFEPPPTLLSLPLPPSGPTRRQTTSSAWRHRAPAPDAWVSEPPAPTVARPSVNNGPVRQQALELDVTVDTHHDAAKGETPTLESPAQPVRSSPGARKTREPEPILELTEHERRDPPRPLVARARPHAVFPLSAMLEPAPIGHPPVPANERENSAPATIRIPRPEPSARDAIQAVQTTNAPQAAQGPTHVVRQTPRTVTAPTLDLQPQRPVVNVVIERLSVQAVTSASASPRPSAPAPPPSMSLEQYLQRRSTRS
jgi:hypothetical protein